jgi:hypothetical protein
MITGRGHNIHGSGNHIAGEQALTSMLYIVSKRFALSHKLIDVNPGELRQPPATQPQPYGGAIIGQPYLPALDVRARIIGHHSQLMDTGRRHHLLDGPLNTAAPSHLDDTARGVF